MRSKVFIGLCLMALVVSASAFSFGDLLDMLHISHDEQVSDPEIHDEEETTCRICTDMMMVIQNALSKLTPEEVHQVGHDICMNEDIVPKHQFDMCRHFVQARLREVVEYLEDHDARDLCVAGELCKPMVMNPERRRAAQVTCDFCMEVVGDSQNALEKYTNEDLKGFMLDVCHSLPDDGQREICKSNVDEYIDLALSLFRYYTPEKMCALIKMCEGEEVDL